MNKTQLELEEQSHREAVTKRRKELQVAKEKRYVSGTDKGRELFRLLFLPYSDAVRLTIDTVMTSKASKWGQFATHTHQLIEELGIEYVAYCAMKKMIDFIDTGNNKLVDIATTIGRTLEAEARINYYIDIGGEETAGLIKAKKKNSSTRHKHIGINCPQKSNS